MSDCANTVNKSATTVPKALTKSCLPFVTQSLLSFHLIRLFLIVRQQKLTCCNNTTFRIIKFHYFTT